MLIRRNLPIYNPKPLLPNINSNKKYEENRPLNAQDRARKPMFNINQGQYFLAYLTKLPIYNPKPLLPNIKVSKGAKIRNRYNQVPHLIQDINGKVTNSQLYTTNESREVSPFPAGDHKAQINRRAQRHNKHKTEKTEKIHKRSTTLERSVKYFTGWLKPVSRRQFHP